jgi:hypothetical protein
MAAGLPSCAAMLSPPRKYNSTAEDVHLPRCMMADRGAPRASMSVAPPDHSECNPQSAAWPPRAALAVCCSSWRAAASGSVNTGPLCGEPHSRHHPIKHAKAFRHSLRRAAMLGWRPVIRHVKTVELGAPDRAAPSTNVHLLYRLSATATRSALGASMTKLRPKGCANPTEPGSRPHLPAPTNTSRCP